MAEITGNWEILGRNQLKKLDIKLQNNLQKLHEYSVLEMIGHSCTTGQKQVKTIELENWGRRRTNYHNVSAVQPSLNQEFLCT